MRVGAGVKMILWTIANGSPRNHKMMHTKTVTRMVKENALNVKVEVVK